MNCITIKNNNIFAQLNSLSRIYRCRVLQIINVNPYTEVDIIFLFYWLKYLQILHESIDNFIFFSETIKFRIQKFYGNSIGGGGGFT